MAERLFAAAATRRRIEHKALSMGTLNLQGRPASNEAIEALRLVGIDLSDHRSQGISIGLLNHADRILVMEQAHEARLRQLSPGLSPKIALLGEFDPDRSGPDEIDDPVGQPLEDFIECRDRLIRCIEAFLDDPT